MTQVSGELLAALHALLDEALDLTPAERSAWLARVRQERPAHAAEIERLLEEEAALDARRFLSPGTAAGEPATLAGRRLGGWTLERPLGQGGMGTVWLARRSDGRFEGTAAVKLLNLALLDPVGAERFRREGTVLARLGHPGIARLLDAGVADGGQPYLVLEHVEGERIDRYCDARRLPPEARLRLFLDVLAAVTHAHANLVVHRDLKPSNILVTADGTVKLLDFGIAKLLEDGPAVTEASTLTDAAGGRALTPEYAAPEQVSGGAVTTATDVYSLGVLLYVLLAGRHPTGEGGRTAAEHFAGILDTVPPRLAAAVAAPAAALRAGSPERLRRLYAGDLENIVAKALRKAPVERYPSVDAFSDDLRRYLADQPVSARPDAWSYRSAKFVRRNRVPVTLGTAALVALAGGLVGTATQAARATAQAARADSAAAEAGVQRDLALGHLSRAEAINALNAFLLTDAAPSGKPFTVGDLLARAESIVGRNFAESEVNRVEMLVSIGQQYLDIDEDARALRVLRRAYDLARPLEESAARAKAACALGRAMARAGALDSARERLLEGLSQLPEATPHATARVSCLLNGAVVARRTGDHALALERSVAARRLALQMSPPLAALQLETLLNLAGSHNALGRRVEADSMYRAAHAQLTALGRENTQTAVTLLNNWGLTLRRMGQPLRAEPLFREAIRISNEGENSRLTSPLVLDNYARVLLALGRTSEALALAGQAYDAARRSGSELGITMALLTRLEAHRDQGDVTGVARILGEVEPRLRRTVPADHYVFAFLMSHRAWLAESRGHPDSAMALASRAVALAEATQGGAQVLAQLLRRRAELNVKLGQGPAAVRDAQRALEHFRAEMQPGEPSATLGLGYLVLGQALGVQGEVARARAALDTARQHLVTTLGANHPITREALASEP